MSKKRLADDPELVKKVITLYVQGYTYRDIAKTVNVSKAGLCNVMHALIQEGVLVGRRKKNGKIETKQPPGTVNCKLGVSRKCIYGASWTASSDGPLCNYILCTGHMRGCPPTACDKFQTGKKVKTGDLF